MSQSLAYIHPEAKIGKNVVIEPFAYISKDVVVGDGTWVGPHAVLMDGARVGKSCRIFPGAVVAGVPQDLKFAGEVTLAEIGDNTTVRECATINRGTVAKGKTSVGSNCLLMAYTHVAHDCEVGNGCILVNGTGLAGEVVVGDFAILGGSTDVHQFVNIGRHAMISGKSGILTDIPPFAKVAGIPAAYIAVNSVGLRRRGYSNEKINEIQEIYRIIYQKGMNNTQALEFIEKNIAPSDESKEIVSFFRNSKRGVVKLAKGELFGMDM